MVSSRPALQTAGVFTAMAFALMFSSGTASAEPIQDTDRAQAETVVASDASGRDIGLGIGLGIGVGHGHHWNHWHDWHDWDDDWDHGHHHGGLFIGLGLGLHIG